MTERDLRAYEKRIEEIQNEFNQDAQNVSETELRELAAERDRKIAEANQRFGVARQSNRSNTNGNQTNTDSEGIRQDTPQSPSEGRSSQTRDTISRTTQSNAIPVNEQIETDPDIEQENTFEVDVLDNPYSGLDSANYRWSWFVTNPILTNNRGSFLRNKLQELDDELNNLANGEFPSNDSVPQKMIIAETGASVYNIESVELKQVVSPNFDTLNAGGLEFKMQVREPGGISLADTLLKAGQLLLANPQKSPYFLELSFIGRDPETGEWFGFDQGGLANNRSARRWIYKVYLVELTSEYGPGGATHDLRFVATGNKGYDLQFSTLTEPLSATHTRVGDFFDTLANQMNKADRDKYGIQRNTFSFDLSRIVDERPELPLKDWTIDRSSLLDALARRSGTQNENSKDNTASFQKGDNVVSIIDTIMANTDQIIKIHEELNVDDQEKESISYLFFVQATVYLKPVEFTNDFKPINQEGNELPIYDPIANDYDRHIVWHVLPFKTRSIIKSTRQGQALEQKNEQQKIMQALVRENRIRKVYEHYHTGLNTEVINFEIKFDTAWVATIPLYNAVSRPVLNPGERQQDSDDVRIASVNTVRQFHDLTERQQRRERIANSLDRYLQALGQEGEGASDAEEQTRQNLLNSLNESPGTGELVSQVLIQRNTGRISEEEAIRQLEEIRDQQADAAQNLGTQRADVRLRLRNISRRRQAANLQTAANIREEGNLAFVEDLALVTPNVQNLLPVTLEPDKLTDNAFSSGISDTTSPSRSIYTSIANQAYSGMIEKNLLRINITIKGDPYWLGSTNSDSIEDEFGDVTSNNSENGLPKLNSGAEYFILRFNLPEKIDEETVQPTLGEANLVTSPYQVLTITHKWESGKWTSELDAIRPPNMNIRGLNAIYRQIDVRV